MTMGRIISAVIGVCYIALAWWVEGREMVLRTIIYLVFPLGFIWFSEAIGNYTGPVTRGGPVTNKSPAFLIALMGWVILLLPAIIALFFK